MMKKHFIALADAIRSTRPDPRVYEVPEAYTIAYRQWMADRDLLARFCASQNYNFNRERWLAYIAGECGPNGGTPQ